MKRIRINLIKILIIIVSVLFCYFVFNSCTQNERVIYYGGKQVINLPVNEKLINTTWKNSDLWILTEKMDSTYIPKEKILKENSTYGIMNGEIVFKESKNY